MAAIITDQIRILNAGNFVSGVTTEQIVTIPGLDFPIQVTIKVIGT